jgi:hypothetical protein
MGRHVDCQGFWHWIGVPRLGWNGNLYWHQSKKGRLKDGLRPTLLIFWLWFLCFAGLHVYKNSKLKACIDIILVFWL